LTHNIFIYIFLIIEIRLFIYRYERQAVGGDKMKCDRCSQEIEPGEEQEHLGQHLCEDCYMDALSPAKACDPWAVHSAQSFAKFKQGELELSEIQQDILRILKETGGVEPPEIVNRLQITETHGKGQR
jgi:hypothetical protein